VSKQECGFWRKTEDLILLIYKVLKRQHQELKLKELT
jgi:hypothetical protein